MTTVNQNVLVSTLSHGMALKEKINFLLDEQKGKESRRNFEKTRLKLKGETGKEIKDDFSDGENIENLREKLKQVRNEFSRQILEEFKEREDFVFLKHPSETAIWGKSVGEEISNIIANIFLGELSLDKRQTFYMFSSVQLSTEKIDVGNKIKEMAAIFNDMSELNLSMEMERTEIPYLRELRFKW